MRACVSASAALAWTLAGLPGPLERKSPSNLSISGASGVSHGTSVTCKHVSRPSGQRCSESEGMPML
eukprot:6190663-Pleurochrysis_carterae.AAC.2